MTLCHRYLSIICGMLLGLSAVLAYAAPVETRWTVNSWGGSSHVFAAADAACGVRDGKPSTSFLLKTRGTGDTELIMPTLLGQNQAYEVSVWLKADKPTKVRLFFRRDGAHYETAAIQTANVTTSWKQVKLKGIYALNTVGKVRLGIEDFNIKLCLNGATLEEVVPSTVGSILSIANVQDLVVTIPNVNTITPEVKLGLGDNVVGGSGGGNFSGLGNQTAAPKPTTTPTTNKATTTTKTTTTTYSLPAYATKTIDNKFFGVHINKLGVHSTWPSFNPGSIRLWDTGTTWANLQPYKGPIQWSSSAHARRLDMYVDYALRNNPDVQIIYTLGMTPEWAGTKHAKACNGSSYGRSVCTMPVNLDDWRNYVRSVGTRYKGKIKVWELWNEADYWGFWDGGAENMATLARITYQELKAIDPNNKVIGPNITGSGITFLSRFLAAGGGSYTDAISVHVYVGRSTDLSTNILRNIRAMLDNHDLVNVPIWNTETNISCNSVLEDCKPIQAGANITSAEDALAQGVISNAALKISDFNFYTWEGASPLYGGKPMVESNYATPTALGRVYGIVKSWLIGSHVDYVQFESNGLNQVRVEKNGKVALVFWTTKANLSLDVSKQPTLKNFAYAGDNFTQKLTSDFIEVKQTPVLLFPDGFEK